MAGDWIKVEAETPDKPEIWQIAQDLEIDPDAVLGKLIRVWLWFDAHTEKCNAPSVTKALLDRHVNVTGFCDSLIRSKWMVEENGQVIIKDWWVHNGKTAKSRLLAAKRQSKLRAKSNAASVTKVTPGKLSERYLDVDVDVDKDTLKEKEKNKAKKDKEKSESETPKRDEKAANGRVAEKKEDKKSKTPRIPAKIIEQIFEDWKNVLGHPSARLGKSRIEVIRKASHMGYTMSDLHQAFIGCKRSAFHMGFNDRSKKYTDIGLILRDEKNIDRFIEYSRTPPRPTWKAGDETPFETRRQAMDFWEAACIEAAQTINGPGSGTTIDAESWETISPKLAH